MTGFLSGSGRDGFDDSLHMNDHASLRGTVALRQLTLTDFRNYQSQRLLLDGRPVVLVGENGSGKTNLLEAVSLLTPGRGMRRARMDEVSRLGAGGRWGVAASVLAPGGPVDLGTGCDTGGERRQVRINGATVSNQTALSDHVRAVWVTPQMNQIFIDGPGERRRFLDRLIYALDPAHAGRVAGFERAMRERAKLLKEQGVRNADPAWLDALEAQMAERGVAVAAVRLDMAERLGRVAAQGFGPFPGADISVAGEVEDWLQDKSAMAAEDNLRQMLTEARAVDAVAGGASIGPHRSDLVVHHIAKSMPANLCSTGEQKALLMALILAHARLLSAESGLVPLLLLDEVVAHLDEERRHALFDAILEGGGQAWLTGTDSASFAALADHAQMFNVHDGKVSEQIPAGP